MNWIELVKNQYAAAQNIDPRKGELYKSIVGKGSQATIEGTDYFAGNLKLFREMGLPLDSIMTRGYELQQDGKTLIFVGTRQTVLGLIAVA